MKINFIVRSKIKGQPATVYMRYSEGREKNFEIKTPERIFPEFWSGKGGKYFRSNIAYTSTFTEKERVAVEGRFSELRQFISSSRLTLKHEVTKEWIIATMNKYYNRIEGGEDLNAYLERYVAEMTSGTRLNGTKRFTRNTILNYESLKSLIGEYQGIYKEKRLKELTKLNVPLRRRITVNFNDITTDFCTDFKNFLSDTNCPNSIHIIIDRLKTVMKASLEEGLHNNNEFQRKGFRSKLQEVQNIALDENEIRKIYELELKNKTLDLVRDTFLCGCYTIQRFSDYSVYRKECIKTIPYYDEGTKSFKEVRMLEFTQQKTGELCTLPLRPELDAILKKYDYTLPRVNYHTMQKNISTVCEKAKISDMVNYEEYNGGLRVKKQVPKYELVKTHTARRSGATNMRRAGVSDHDIMKIGGWRTMANMLKYLKMTQEETALKLVNNPFFMGNPLSVAK